MDIKKFFKSKRDGLQQAIYFVINPIVRGLIKIGFTPNTVTTIGFLGNLVAAGMFIYAGQISTPLRLNLCDYELIISVYILLILL